MMNGSSKFVEEENNVLVVKKPGPLRTWNENTAESDLEVPGTPRTPRTSKTPGRICLPFHQK